jgi:uncharacterized membrane protein
MFSFLMIFLALSNVIARVLFNVATKQAKDKLLFFFWSFAVANILFSATFFATQLHSGATLSNVIPHFFSLFQENFYFYIIRAFDFLFCNIIFLYLLETYELSAVILVLQFTVLTSAAFYYVLGSPTSFLSVAGALTVFTGAIISGFKRFEYPNILKPLTQIPLPLYMLGFAKACLTTIDRSLLIVISDQTPETIKIHNLMKQIPFSNSFPIIFYSTLEYAVGLIPTITFVYFCYLIFIRKNTLSQLGSYLTTYSRSIIFAGVMYYMYIYFFIYVFQYIDNKLILTVIEKLTIPLNLFLAYLILKEKITFPQKIATVLIISGGILSVL